MASTGKASSSDLPSFQGLNPGGRPSIDDTIDIPARSRRRGGAEAAGAAAGPGAD